MLTIIIAKNSYSFLIAKSESRSTLKHPYTVPLGRKIKGHGIGGARYSGGRNFCRNGGGVVKNGGMVFGGLVLGGFTVCNQSVFFYDILL